MRIRTVLFDLDGTVLDHFSAIHRSHNHVRRHYGLPDATRLEIMQAIGGGLPEALGKTLGPSHRHLLDEALPIYRAYWDATMLDDVALFPGVRELLVALHGSGVKCAVFTNKHGPSARRVCTHLGLDPYLGGVFGATDTPWLKPDPAFTAHALNTLGASAVETALVGDSPWDILAALRGGLAACYGLTTGTHTAAELIASGAQPERVFADCHALTPVLLAATHP